MRFGEQMDLWLGNRKRIVVLNREDMISRADRDAWASYYARQGTKVVFSNGQFGSVFKISTHVDDLNHYKIASLLMITFNLGMSGCLEAD